MSEGLLATFGIASAVVNTVGLVPYVKDIFKHKTKPERAAWWIWTALGVIAFIAQLAAGATWSIVFVASALAAEALIAILSLSYGYGKFRQRDFISLLFALGGVILWKFTNEPIYALLIVVCIDAVAVWLTAVKTWEAPYTETLFSWICAGIAGGLGALAVGALKLTTLIYPLYILTANILVTAMILYRRPRVRKSQYTS
jgi:hypothetical protein